MSKSLFIGCLATLAMALLSVTSCQRGADVSTDQPSNPKTDKELLQGSWQIVTAERRGKAISGEALKEFQRIAFFDDELLFDRDDRQDFRLDPEQKPKSIDLIGIGTSSKGIYELDGDQLKLALSLPAKERPTDFSSPSGSDHVLLVLKRDTSAESEDIVKEALAMDERRGIPRGWPHEQRGSFNLLKQLGLAMLTYADNHGRFPPAASRGKDGKSLLSWRVLILPDLGQGRLYEEFKLDEPWDSPHNIKLLGRSPYFYSVQDNQKGLTTYQVVVGPGTLFESADGYRIKDVADGVANTLMIVETADAVPWTKPADLVYDPNKPLPKFGGFVKNGFNALLADGSTRVIRSDFDDAMMRRFITRNDGQPLDFDKLLLKGIR